MWSMQVSEMITSELICLQAGSWEGCALVYGVLLPAFFMIRSMEVMMHISGHGLPQAFVWGSIQGV